MSKILNLVIVDRADLRSTKIIVESFAIRDDVTDPEWALRKSVRDFVYSGAENAKQALDYANGSYNWGDVITTVPDEVFAKNGLTRLKQNAVDVHVDHDEILCDMTPAEMEDDA